MHSPLHSICTCVYTPNTTPAEQRANNALLLAAMAGGLLTGGDNGRYSLSH